MLVGLGNPGAEYDKTRHNTGFMAIDKIAESLQVNIMRSKFQGLTAMAEYEGRKLLLLKPQTFMNRSGLSVAEAARYYQIPTERILVIFDDISLPIGRIRVRTEGSAGGHNGLKSIIAQLGSQAFPRVKIGVGEKPHPDYDLADWVLSRFGREDLGKLEEVLRTVPGAVRLLLEGDYAGAQNRFNR